VPCGLHLVPFSAALRCGRCPAPRSGAPGSMRNSVAG
jgi:hypothetical protein